MMLKDIKTAEDFMNYLLGCQDSAALVVAYDGLVATEQFRLREVFNPLLLDRASA